METLTCDTTLEILGAHAGEGVRVVVQHDVHAHAHRCTQVADLMEALEYLDYRGKLSPSLFAKLSALLQVCMCALTCMHRAPVCSRQ